MGTITQAGHGLGLALTLFLQGTSVGDKPVLIVYKLPSKTYRALTSE